MPLQRRTCRVPAQTPAGRGLPASLGIASTGGLITPGGADTPETSFWCAHPEETGQALAQSHPCSGDPRSQKRRGERGAELILLMGLYLLPFHARIPAVRNKAYLAPGAELILLPHLTARHLRPRSGLGVVGDRFAAVLEPLHLRGAV